MYIYNIYALQTFGLRETKIMEYYSDLNNYYKDSYGYAGAQKLPCSIIKDMLERMKDTTNRNKITAYFGHATILLMIFSALGIDNDAIPPMADNYSQENHHQRFQSSQLVPYASNFAAVQYRCVPEMGGTKVLFFLNQALVKMDWCREAPLCSIDEIETMFVLSPMFNCPYDICGSEFASRYVTVPTVVGEPIVSPVVSPIVSPVVSPVVAQAVETKVASVVAAVLVAEGVRPVAVAPAEASATTPATASTTIQTATPVADLQSAVAAPTVAQTISTTNVTHIQ